MRNVALFLFILQGCFARGPSPHPAVITVFSPASIADAVAAIARRFEAAQGGKLKVRCNSAASSTLAKQVDSGAPADLFISADPKWMVYLEKRGRIQAATTRDIAGNELVLIAPRGRSFALVFEKGSALAGAFPGRLAMGDPEHVPAGAYARQALEHFGWWGGVKDRVLPAADVRAALHLVELGEAGAGIVYKTDAIASGKVDIVGIFPRDGHEPIRYSAALVEGARGEGRAFLELLSGQEAQEVLVKRGFTPPAR